jgi:hypothetical protein
VSTLPALRVRDVAARLLVDEHRVLAWIRSGKLLALDVSAGDGKKARWRIRPEDLAELEALLTTVPPAKPARRKSKSGWQYSYF